MKFLNIRIKGYKQFKDTFIDFTDPETGKAADKICLIGRNGTGKSTLLDFINNIILNLSSNSIRVWPYNFAIKFNHNNSNFYYFNYYYSEYLNTNSSYNFFSEDIEKEDNWFEMLSTANPVKYQNIASNVMQNFREISEIRNSLMLKPNSSDLLIYSPAEGIDNSYLGVIGVPESNVNTALSLFNDFPFNHIVSNETVKEFWTSLIYLIKKRDEEREEFEISENNINKTKKDLIAEFDKINPKILDGLSEIWNKILGKADLFFDAKQANSPYQLTDNLYANIFEKKLKKQIEYNQLSTGIRNFIFRIGHIYSLYFNREIKNGIVLVDEIENSLFPDFLYDLVKIYEQIFIDKKGENNTQFFVATHSPIIAAQYKPYERIILEWDTPGSIKAYRGQAPEGDDPNDILTKDFGVKHLMGEKGQEMWKEYLELRKNLRNTSDENNKKNLVDRITEIGDKYNF